MRNITLVLTIAATMSGCASFNHQTIDTKSVADMKGQTATHSARAKPDFAALTAGKATFALVGGIAMVVAGNNIVANNKIADPADVIATGLAKELENAYGVRLVTPPAKVSEDDAGRVAASVNDAAKFVIDAQTINWSFGYFPTDWTHYRVIYTAKARLIDVQKKTVVAEGFCKHFPDSNLNAPTYEELLANEASRLKGELNTIAKECVKSMKTQMLSL